MRTKRNGITLVEVILVAAVLLILLTLVTPALRAAGRRSRDEVCLSNLRALGVAVRLYATAHDGTLPGGLYPLVAYPLTSEYGPIHDEYQARRMLPTLLEDVVPDACGPRLIRCPVMGGLVPDEHFERFYKLTNRRTANAHYALNNVGMIGGPGGPSGNPRVTDPMYYFGYSPSYPNPIDPDIGPRRYGEIPNPDREWMIADAWYRARPNPGFPEWQQEGPYQYAWSGEALPYFAPHGPRAAQRYLFESSDRRNAEAARIRQAKADGWTNTLYFDGHAAPSVSRTLVINDFELLYGFRGTVNPFTPPTLPTTWR